MSTEFKIGDYVCYHRRLCVHNSYLRELGTGRVWKILHPERGMHAEIHIQWSKTQKGWGFAKSLKLAQQLRVEGNTLILEETK